MFLELQIDGVKCLFSIDSILSVKRCVDNKATITLKSDPNLDIKTDTMYAAVSLSLTKKSSLDEAAEFIISLKPQINKFFSLSNK